MGYNPWRDIVQAPHLTFGGKRKKVGSSSTKNHCNYRLTIGYWPVPNGQLTFYQLKYIPPGIIPTVSVLMTSLLDRS